MSRHFGFVYHDTNGPNHGPAWKIQSFLLNEICTVILDYHGKGNLRRSYWSMGWGKISNWECLFVHCEKGLFFSVYVDDIKLAGKKQNINPMWKVTKQRSWFWENQHLSLIMFNLGCTQRPCEISKDIVDNYRTMFESSISAGATENLPWSENLSISSWSYDLEHHAKKCGTILWVGKQDDLNNSTKVSTPCIDDHHFNEEELKSVGEFSKACSQIVLNYFHWRVLEDPIFSGQWINLHDQSLNGPKHVTNDYLFWSLTFITQANTNNIVMWERL